MTAVLEPPRDSRPLVAPSHSGEGVEARFLERYLLQARASWRRSEGRRSLEEALAECVGGRTIPDWDGEGGLALSEEAISEAQRFIGLLPEGLATPEVLPEPDGGIAFEWFVSREYTFLVSVTGRGLLVYAGLFGPDNATRGSERFRATIPNVVLDHVRRVCAGRG